MLGRATPLWILGFVSFGSGLLSTIVVLQFTGLLPWVGDKGTHIGGPWTAAVTYGMAALAALGAGYGWLTIKSWSSMITIFAAALGIFAPFISYMDGTDPRSSAIAPVVTSVLMLFLVFRRSTNRAMASALSDQKSGKSSRNPAPAKPMSAARKREVAEEQRRAVQQGALVPTTASPAVTMQSVSSVNSVASTALAAASTTAAQAISALPESAPVRPIVANVARNAAAALGMSSRSPAKPNNTSAMPVPPVAPASPAPPQGPRPSGFRADDV